MRTRYLRPKFFVHDGLTTLPFEARILFQGLWCMADREGRLKDRPKRIKVCVLPYDEVNVDPLLEELQKIKVIRRYAVNGERYIDIPSFAEDGSPHTGEPASTLPPCPVNWSTQVIENTKLGASSAEAPSELRTCIVKSKVKVKVKSNKDNSEKNGSLFNEAEATNDPNNAVKRVFDAYVESWNRTDRYELSSARRDMIVKALAKKGEALCLIGIENFRKDDYERRSEFNGLEYLFGNEKRIDRWCRIKESPAMAKSRAEHERDQDVLNTSLEMVEAMYDENGNRRDH